MEHYRIALPYKEELASGWEEEHPSPLGAVWVVGEHP